MNGKAIKAAKANLGWDTIDTSVESTAAYEHEVFRFHIEGMRHEYDADGSGKDVFVLTAPRINVDMAPMAESMREQGVPNWIADRVLEEAFERLQGLMLADVMSKRMTRVS